jgi:predicted AAA+ superfamily ATPase
MDSFLYWFGVTDNPDNLKCLEWKGKTTLLAYFIDMLLYEANINLWNTAESIFNKKNLRQTKNNYLGNKNKSGKPTGYETIDEILRKAGIN